MMAQSALVMGQVATEYTLGFQHPDDPVAEGDLVPVIVLALRPAAPKPEAPDAAIPD